MIQNKKVQFYEEQLNKIEEEEWNEISEKIWLNWIYHYIIFGIKEIRKSSKIEEIRTLQNQLLELIEIEGIPRKEELKKILEEATTVSLHFTINNYLLELKESIDCKRCNELYDIIYDYLDSSDNLQEKEYIQRQLQIIRNYKYN